MMVSQNVSVKRNVFFVCETGHSSEKKQSGKLQKRSFRTMVAALRKFLSEMARRLAGAAAQWPNERQR
jgi:hypothetical protein